MEDNRLVFSVCILVAVIGILLQSFSSVREVDYLYPDLVGEEVLVRGVVQSKRVSDGHVFLVVNGFNAVIFEKEARASSIPYFLLDGDQVFLRGEVRDYDGELELVVSEVWLC